MSCKIAKNQVLTALSLAAILLSQGCASVRTGTRDMTPGETVPFDAEYDYTDLRTLSRNVAEKALAHEFLETRDEPPIVVVLGIENRTLHHIDMQAISDSIRTVMMDSGKIRFVNPKRRADLLREQQYQQEQVTPATRAALRSQLGAKYMLTGSLVEIKKRSGREVRLARREEVYYQLTVEVTDLEDGVIAWSAQEERVRRASRPIIGW